MRASTEGHREWRAVLVARAVIDTRSADTVGTMWSSVQCPYCGSFRTGRERGQWEWLWLVAAAGTFFPRWLASFARQRDYRELPGVYRCAHCGRTFIFIL